MRQPLFGAQFLFDWQNLETFIPQKLVWGQHEPKSEFPWDYFKPYLSFFEPVVLILEDLAYPSTTFLGSIFGR